MLKKKEKIDNKLNNLVLRWFKVKLLRTFIHRAMAEFRQARLKGFQGISEDLRNRKIGRF